MAREIKFRAWNIAHSRMMPAFELDDIAAQEYAGYSWLECFGEYDERNFKIENWQDLKLMQYTGLKDKKGKEIYEGDIIKISYGTVNFENKKEVVTDVYFEKAAFRYRHKDGSGSVLDFNSVKIVKGYERITQDVEIIGNIYENPELLNND